MPRQSPVAVKQALASLSPWPEPHMGISLPRGDREASLRPPAPGGQGPCPSTLEEPSCPQEPFRELEKVFLKQK